MLRGHAHRRKDSQEEKRSKQENRVQKKCTRLAAVRRFKKAEDNIPRTAGRAGQGGEGQLLETATGFELEVQSRCLDPHFPCFPPASRPRSTSTLARVTSCLWDLLSISPFSPFSRPPAWKLEIMTGEESRQRERFVCSATDVPVVSVAEWTGRCEQLLSLFLSPEQS